MIRSDYFMRQLAQFIQTIINFLLKRDIPVSSEEEEKYLNSGFKILGVDKDKILTMSVENIIDSVSEKGASLEEIEAIAYLLLLEQQIHAISHKDTVKKLLFYVEEQSKVYSVDRRAIIESLS